MDSLRKRPEQPSQPRVKPFVPQPTPFQPKREELFISRQDSQRLEKSAHMQRLEQQEKTFQKSKRIKKIFKIFFLSIIILMFCLGIYFFAKAYLISKKMNSASPASSFTQDVKNMVAPVLPSARDPLNGEDSGRINLLLMGAAGEHQPGGNLTDTVMVMSINTQSKKVSLLSLPRDFYVPIPGTKNYTKLNSLYPIGIKAGVGADYIKQTVENITGLTINYYAAVDFNAFEKIVDDIGGVNITNERDIYDPTYPGPNYSYQTFALSKGFHTLDGKTALQYVRERHDDPQGDFGRALRQQQVIQAVKNKMFSVQTMFNVVALNNILDTLGDNIRTDITFGQLDSFIKLSKTLDLQNITNVVVDAWKPDSLLKVSHVQLGNANAFILLPRVGNYSEIQDLAQNIFDQTEIKKRAEQIKNEDANIVIINESSDPKLASKIQTLLSSRLNMNNVKIVANTNHASSNKTFVEDNSDGQKIFTLDEIIKKIPATISSDDTASNNSDLTIILGNDIVDTYKYEEASVDDFNKAQDSQDQIDFTNIND